MYPGTVISDRYRLLRPLGAGGTAHVWAALDLSLNREVAVKVLSAATASPAERERLRREARVLAALDHPRITTVYDFLEVLDQAGAVAPVLVTELLDGVGLDARLRSGPLDTGAALEVCAQLADALSAAHRAGIAHRDVKPGNVMLTSRGLKLLDFGIARGEADTQLTGSMVIGSPVCMAPEQWSGRGAGPASDVYALGCVLFWCLAGGAPYPYADIAALGMAHLQADPPPLPVPVPEAITGLYLACMAKEPARRPTAEQVYGALAAPPGEVGFASIPANATRSMPPLDRTGPVAPVDAPPPVRRAGARARRRTGPLWAVAGGVVLVGAVLALILTRQGGSPTDAASGTGTGSPTATSAASPSASVGAIVLPSSSTTTPTSASPTPTETTASPVAPSTSADPAAVALGELQTIADQIKTMNDQASPEPAYQDLLGRVDDIEQSVRHDEQNTGPDPWHDVNDKITAFDQQLIQDAKAGQISDADAERLGGEMQQVSNGLPSSG